MSTLLVKSLRQILLSILSVACICSSCSEDDGVTDQRKANQEEVVKAWNKYEFTMVDELPPPPAATNGRTNYVAAGGKIISTQTKWINQNGGSNPASPEQWARALDYGYVVTGIGAQISSSSNNYTYIVVEYRYINSDYSLGPRYRMVSPSGATVDPWTLEAWSAADEGDVGWGVAVRGKYDVQRLEFYTRELNTTTGRLSGAEQMVVSGVNTGLRVSIKYTPGDPTFSLDPDRTVLLSLGLTSNSAGTSYMIFDVGSLQ